MVHGVTKYDSLQSKFQKSKCNTAEAGNEKSYEEKKTSTELLKGFAWRLPPPSKKIKERAT